MLRCPSWLSPLCRPSPLSPLCSRSVTSGTCSFPDNWFGCDVGFVAKDNPIKADIALECSGKEAGKCARSVGTAVGAAARGFAGFKSVAVVVWSPSRGFGGWECAALESRRTVLGGPGGRHCGVQPAVGSSGCACWAVPSLTGAAPRLFPRPCSNVNIPNVRQ